jgi:hypothetical protein
MPKLVIGFMVAFSTFGIGVMITAVSKVQVHVSSQPARNADPVSFFTEPGKFPPAVLKAEQYSDLSIMIDGSEPNPSPPSLKGRHIRIVERGPAAIQLDVGESIDDQEVTLSFRGDDEYRMFQRYRTSMTISAEGPHLDLLNWRHFDSPWTQLKALSSNRFRTLATNQMDGSRFPSTTNAEIVAEVHRQVGADWSTISELAEDCSGPNDGACLVLISSIYLRIQKRVHARWIDVGIVEIRLPMGC